MASPVKYKRDPSPSVEVASCDLGTEAGRTRADAIIERMRHPSPFLYKEDGTKWLLIELTEYPVGTLKAYGVQVKWPHSTR